MTREFTTDSDDATMALGRQLAAEVRAPLVILLIGDMGAGKTTFSKGLISGLGAAREEDVTSPTFTLVHQYGNVFHIDLYRIETAATGGRDFDTLGLDDVFDRNAVIIVEWGEKAASRFPGRRWEIRFTDLGGDRRQINLQES